MMQENALPDATDALDDSCCVREARGRMKNLLLTAVAAAALLPLAACQQAPETVDSRAPDPMASQLANAAAVELPPAIKASVAFRCKDNSLVYVDFFEGDKMANLRTVKGGAPTMLNAPEAGQPLTGGGYSLTGTPKSISLVKPAGVTLACTA